MSQVNILETMCLILVIVSTFLFGALFYLLSELERTRKEAKLWYDTLKVVAQQRDESDSENHELKQKLRCYESSKVKWKDLK